MDDGESGEYGQAASGYLVWPLALVALVRADPGASDWFRIHTRQAAAFGLAATLCGLVLFALPLVIVVVWPAVTTTNTVFVYGIAIGLDTCVFAYFVVRALGYASRAARGELFSLGVLSALADRLFSKQRR